MIGCNMDEKRVRAALDEALLTKEEFDTFVANSDDGYPSWWPHELRAVAENSDYEASPEHSDGSEASSEHSDGSEAFPEHSDCEVSPELAAEARGTTPHELVLAAPKPRPSICMHGTATCTSGSDAPVCSNHVCTLYCEFAGCDGSANAHLFGQHQCGPGGATRAPTGDTTRDSQQDSLLTSVFDAVEAESVGAVERIVQLDPKAACKYNGAGRSALHEACDKGADAISLLLLKHGADPVAKDLCAKSPLHIASYVGSYPVVKVQC